MFKCGFKIDWFVVISNIYLGSIYVWGLADVNGRYEFFEKFVELFVGDKHFGESKFLFVACIIDCVEILTLSSAVAKVNGILAFFAKEVCNLR